MVVGEIKGRRGEQVEVVQCAVWVREEGVQLGGLEQGADQRPVLRG